jgi:hypothetical protein
MSLVSKRKRCAIRAIIAAAAEYNDLPFAEAKARFLPLDTLEEDDTELTEAAMDRMFPMSEKMKQEVEVIDG